jgi:hypothetical protein
LPITYANPPAKKAPTIQENKIGRPMPPKKPVVAGLTASIDSIAGPDINLKRTNPVIITRAIP